MSNNLEREIRRRVDAYNREVRRVNDARRRAVDDFNREQQRRADAYRRAAEAAARQQQRQVDDYNRHLADVNAHNRKANAHNAAVISELQRRPGVTVRFHSQSEEALVDRVHKAVALQDDREYDVFLSYAHIDGNVVAHQLRDALEQLDVRVWIDDVMVIGQGMARQMDRGLLSSRCGIALLTPAYG